jgi:hypothetical protein
VNDSDPTRLSDDDLREGWFSLSEGATPGPDCPGAERLMEAIEGALDPTITREIVDHTSTCASCAEAWRLARELIRESEPEAEEAPVREVRGWAAYRRYVIAAAAAIVALVGVGVLQDIWDDDPIYRGSENDPQSLVERDSLPREDFLLRWTPGPEGSRYRVEVLTEDLEPVAASEGLRTPEFEVSGELLRELPSGAALLWQVEVELPTGQPVSSATFTTRIE